MAKGMILRRGGAAGGLPNFAYTGTYTLIDDGDRNWRIKFLTSGTLVMAKDCTIDVFCVGGGGGTSAGSGSGASRLYAGGGGGGYTYTQHGVVLQKSTEYRVVIGAGGIASASTIGNQGGTTSFDVVISASGGYGGTDRSAGAGGSGGGRSSTGGADGTGGSDGSSPSGAGQGTTTREFGEAAGDLYAGGGGGSYYSDSITNNYGGDGGGGMGANLKSGKRAGTNGEANTGGGAGAEQLNGGSGIVVIRNHREAAA